MLNNQFQAENLPKEELDFGANLTPDEVACYLKVLPYQLHYFTFIVGIAISPDFLAKKITTRLN